MLYLSGLAKRLIDTLSAGAHWRAPSTHSSVYAIGRDRIPRRQIDSTHGPLATQHPRDKPVPGRTEADLWVRLPRRVQDRTSNSTTSSVRLPTARTVSSPPSATQAADHAVSPGPTTASSALRGRLRGGDWFVPEAFEPGPDCWRMQIRHGAPVMSPRRPDEAELAGARERRGAALGDDRAEEGRARSPSGSTPGSPSTASPLRVRRTRRMRSGRTRGAAMPSCAPYPSFRERTSCRTWAAEPVVMLICPPLAVISSDLEPDAIHAAAWTSRLDGAPTTRPLRVGMQSCRRRLAQAAKPYRPHRTRRCESGRRVPRTSSVTRVVAGLRAPQYRSGTPLR
jgi:hypothetical protein